ncbi:UvrD-helicase domain-containing protein [Macrococcus capreoli]|uniref:UvrD-helicase domain-containing protein n=1 Tax=Macrococcus capreoli TaxID=2982690 RepID=UPI003EE4FD8B
MDKKIILAAAGAGKTYYIANNFKVDEKVILISFTNSNVNNIRLEVMNRYNGILPSNVQIMTFDSFVYNHLIKPFEPLFLQKKSRGIDIRTVPIEDARDRRYIKDKFCAHYINKYNEFYVSRLGKLFLKFNKDRQKLIINRLERYCDAIYIDEFQDYNGYDFKVIKFLLEKTNIKVTAVGDINQSCLVPLRCKDNSISKQPFYTINNIDEFKSKLSNKIIYDESSLISSRRVPKVTCEFISNNLGIDIQSSSSESSSIIFLENMEEITDVIKNDSIPKLVWNKGVNNPFVSKYINWSYSKGDTYPKACIILTSTTNNIDNWRNITSNKTKNALYVALTRSKGDIYIIKSTDYKKWCESNKNFE